MLELPEVITAADQLNQTIRGKKITNAIANHTPHKLAWFNGDPQGYLDLLIGKTIGDACGVGSMVDIAAEDVMILIGEGIGLRYHQPYQLVVDVS